MDRYIPPALSFLGFLPIALPPVLKRTLCWPHSLCSSPSQASLPPWYPLSQVCDNFTVPQTCLSSSLLASHPQHPQYLQMAIPVTALWNHSEPWPGLILGPYARPHPPPGSPLPDRLQSPPLPSEVHLTVLLLPVPLPLKILLLVQSSSYGELQTLHAPTWTHTGPFSWCSYLVIT